MTETKESVCVLLEQMSAFCKPRLQAEAAAMIAKLREPAVHAPVPKAFAEPVRLSLDGVTDPPDGHAYDMGTQEPKPRSTRKHA